MRQTENQRASHELQVFATNGRVFTISLQTSWKVVTSKTYFWLMALFSLLVALFDAPVFRVKLSFLGRFLYWYLDCMLVTAFWGVQAFIMLWLIHGLKLRLRNYALMNNFFNIALMVWLNYWVSYQVLGLDKMTALQVWGEVLRYTLVGSVIEILIVAFVLPQFEGVGFMSWREAMLPEVDSLQVNGRKIPLTELRYIKSVEHYVELVTDHGTTLERASLKNLVKQLEGAGGIQPHRSYWVARRAAPELKHEGGHQILELDDGVTIPVARARVSNVQKWIKNSA